MQMRMMFTLSNPDDAAPRLAVAWDADDATHHPELFERECGAFVDQWEGLLAAWWVADLEVPDADVLLARDHRPVPATVA